MKKIGILESGLVGAFAAILTVAVIGVANGEGIPVGYPESGEPSWKSSGHGHDIACYETHGGSVWVTKTTWGGELALDVMASTDVRCPDPQGTANGPDIYWPPGALYWGEKEHPGEGIWVGTDDAVYFDTDQPWSKRGRSGIGCYCKLDAGKWISKVDGKECS